MQDPRALHFAFHLFAELKDPVGIMHYSEIVEMFPGDLERGEFPTLGFRKIVSLERIRFSFLLASSPFCRAH